MPEPLSLPAREMNSLSDSVRLLTNYLTSVFHRSHSIDGGAPMARRARGVGFFLFVLFIGLPTILLFCATNFPHEMNAVLTTLFPSAPLEK